MNVYLIDVDNGESWEDGEFELHFYWEKEDGYMTDCSFGKIIEMELKE